MDMRKQADIQATTVVPVWFAYEGSLEDDGRQKAILTQLDEVQDLTELHRLGWRIDTQRFAEITRIDDVNIGLTFEEVPNAKKDQRTTR